MTQVSNDSSPVNKDELLLDVVNLVADAYQKTQGSADIFGIWCMPHESMLLSTCIEYSGDSFAPWKHRHPDVPRAILSLWSLMDRSWSCLILVISAKTGEFKVEFLNEAEIERDLEPYYDFPGQTRQFLAVSNGSFKHVS